MQFNQHFDLVGRHAFLSASKYSWIRYDDDKLIETWRNSKEAMRGTELHEFASRAIHLGIKLPRTNKTINMFVNDVIGFRMASEQVLFYSDNIFGTADAIKYDSKKNRLMIFDLKNGVSKASFDQLLIYAAMFCLEYHFDPKEIEEIELRIYQNDEVQILFPVLEDIQPIIAKIIKFDQMIETLKAEARGALA